MIAFEFTKLLLQLLGALLVAYVAVRWALKRYKSEKVWERKLSANVDVVTALAEIRLIVGRWSDEVLERRKTSPSSDKAHRKRYGEAKRKLDECAAIALLLLPKDVSDLLNGIERSIQQSKTWQDQYDDLESEYKLINKALKELIDHGKHDLGQDIISVA